MPNGLDNTRLGEFQPKEVGFACPPCYRNATATLWVLWRRFGKDLALGEVARRLAQESRSGNPCRQPEHCLARAYELPVATWATLDDARRGKWRAWLSCARRFEGLKATNSCAGRLELDLDTLVAMLRCDFPLARLGARLRCPRCGSSLVAIEWEEPPPPPPPREEVDRLPDGRPTGVDQEAVAFNQRRRPRAA